MLSVILKVHTLLCPMNRKYQGIVASVHMVFILTGLHLLREGDTLSQSPQDAAAKKTDGQR